VVKRDLENDGQKEFRGELTVTQFKDGQPLKMCTFAYYFVRFQQQNLIEMDSYFMLPC
jgi:hypothetical protein